ncbi:type III-A CRISPR-associated protein Csm2 [Ignavibacterium sp.]|uniref:type III-A CRISPR-associated protein Csm2 n=1 Tax=Ignavibacterium sp. TaxID=2651167 RepID=UPI00307E15DD
MTNENAVKFRKELDELEQKLKSEKNKDKDKKREIEGQIEALYKKIFNDFERDIEISSVQNIDEQCILFSEFFGRFLVFLDLSTSQIRNVYGDVMKMKMKGFNKNELMLLKPRLAYTTERKGTEGSKKFREKIERALDKVIFAKENQEQLFQNFANFFEAILAYHRSFGGK